MKHKSYNSLDLTINYLASGLSIRWESFVQAIEDQQEQVPLQLPAQPEHAEQYKDHVGL